MFKDAEVNDRVYSLRLGWCDIITKEGNCTDDSIAFLVRNDENVSIWMTDEGKQDKKDEFPTFFWNEVLIEVPERPTEPLERGTLVWAWNDNDLEATLSFYVNVIQDSDLFLVRDNPDSPSPRLVQYIEVYDGTVLVKPDPCPEIPDPDPTDPDPENP